MNQNQTPNRKAVAQFLKKMMFTLTVDEALQNESCMIVFKAYSKNLASAKLASKSTTQRESYEAIKEDLGERQQLVLDVIKSNPGSSRAELTTLINGGGTPIRHSSVTGRCRELLDYGLIKKLGTKFDPITQRNVETLEAA